MALLSWADLSYVLPVTSIGYVLVALMGKLLLHEQITLKRWAGIAADHGRRGAGERGTRAADGATHGAPAPMKWIYIAIIVAATTVGEVMQAAGHAAHGEIRDFRPGAIGRAAAALARNRFVIGSVVAMAVSFFAYHGAAYRCRLSFAVPVTAVTYVLETVLAKYLLKERVTWLRWAGASLVICGVALVSL